MNIEEAIDIIDKELHKKWDKKVEKKDGQTYIHLGDEEPLNEFEEASQRCLVEVQSLNREIERLHSIIKEVREYIEKSTQWYDKELGLVEMEGYDSNRIPVVYLYGLLEIIDKENIWI